MAIVARILGTTVRILSMIWLGVSLLRIAFGFGLGGSPSSSFLVTGLFTLILSIAGLQFGAWLKTSATPPDRTHNQASNKHSNQQSIMGIINRLFGSYAEANYIKDAEKLFAICRSYGPEERGQLYASVVVSIAFLMLDRDDEKNDSILLAIDAMESGRPLSKTEMGQLSIYNMRLAKFQQQLHNTSSPVNSMIAAGIPIFITSIRALMNLSLQPHIRELWSILMSGDRATALTLLDEITERLGAHPLAEQIQRSNHISTPDSFLAR